jgi:protease IV
MTPEPGHEDDAGSEPSDSSGAPSPGDSSGPPPGGDGPAEGPGLEGAGGEPAARLEGAGASSPSQRRAPQPPPSPREPGRRPDPEPIPTFQAAGSVPQGIPYVYPRAPQSPRGRGLSAFMAVGILLGSFCCLFSMFASGGAGMGGAVPMQEEVLAGTGDGKVVLIELEGVIAPTVGTGGLFGLSGVDLVESLQRQFDRAADDPQVKAVLLSIDSPGGTVTTSDQIWHMVQRFRKRTGKPVVVHMGSMCASGGYYVAVAADKLMCEPTTITGSIGVILSGLNFHELLERYGVQDVTIASGDNKALLSPTAPVSDEHREILQGLVSSMQARFVKLVAEGRSLSVEEVEAFADGRIVTAEQALELKMVDDIGYREDAFALARELARVPQAQLIRYTRPPGLGDLLAGARTDAGGLSALIGAPGRANSETRPLDAQTLADQLSRPRLLVLWRGE